jgi:hypothetical protein
MGDACATTRSGLPPVVCMHTIDTVPFSLGWLWVATVPWAGPAFLHGLFAVVCGALC